MYLKKMHHFSNVIYPLWDFQNNIIVFVIYSFSLTLQLTLRSMFLCEIFMNYQEIISARKLLLLEK